MLVFGVILGLVTFYLHRRLVVATRLPRGARWAADAVLVLFWAAAVVGSGNAEVLDPSWAMPIAFPGLVWLAALFYLTVGAMIIGVIALLVRAGSALTRRDGTSARTSFVRASSAVLVVGTVGAVGYGVVEAANPQVTRTAVALDDLPSTFEGTSVALVSDLHIGPSRGRDFVSDLVETINAEDPDLILVAGDLVDGRVDLVGDELAPLAELDAPLGVYVTSGNHEFYAGDGGRWLDLYDSLGLTVLRNESVTLTRGDDRIDLVGIEDATAPDPFAPDLVDALAGTTPEGFSLLVAHQPLQALEASDLGVDFQVSGHTHAGQIWPIRYLVPLQQPTVEGLDIIGDTTVFTTRGAGTWGPPVRVAAPPEVSMLELQRP